MQGHGRERTYKIIFYVDRQGRATLLDYMAKLKASKSKDSRIKPTKIREYVSKGACDQRDMSRRITRNTLTGKYGNYGQAMTASYSPDGMMERLSFFMAS